MNRVVITGVGAVTPLGNDAPSTWRRALDGESGVDFVTAFDTAEFPVHIAAEVKGFEPNGLLPPKEMKRIDRNVQFALVAANEALLDAGGPNGYAPERVGVVLGSGIGGLHELLRQYDVLKERGPSRVSPTFLPNVLPDSASGQVAIALGLRGPNYAVVSACATGSHAIGEGAELVRHGHADAVLAGGTEACIHPLFFAGFCSMRGLVDESEPARASRPFDATRAGFVMGEGAGLVMLEEYEHARKRGATIYAEVLGYGASNDAYHMAAPDPDSVGVVEMMRSALGRAGVDPGRVDYINAHGTSTPLGDAAETKAIKDVFGRHAYDLAVSSTKSTMGHLLGAAGAVEAIMTALAIHHRVLPPTINYRNPDPACDLDYVPNDAREAEIDVALSNAMGLGGHNGCVLLGRVA